LRRRNSKAKAIDKETGDVKTIGQHANETLAEYQRMRDWFVWPDEDFPRSSTQKPRRNLIRDAVEASLRGRAHAYAASPLAELLTRITGRSIQNMQSLTPDANLEGGLGLSSLDRVELLSALEDRYQIDLSEAEFANAATVGDLEKLLQGEVWRRRSAPPQGGIAPPPHKRDSESLREVHYPRWALRWPTTCLPRATHYLRARPAA